MIWLRKKPTGGRGARPIAFDLSNAMLQLRRDAKNVGVTQIPAPYLAKDPFGLLLAQLEEAAGVALTTQVDAYPQHSFVTVGVVVPIEPVAQVRQSAIDAPGVATYFLTSGDFLDSTKDVMVV